MNTIKAWHFAANNKKLRYSDHRPVRRNVRYFARPKNKELELCKHGMHGSKNILDALKWAPGSIVTWCEFGGRIVHEEDKLTAEWRKPLWVYDATELLQEFAHWCALKVIHLWECPDVVKQYFETGNEEFLREASSFTTNMFYSNIHNKVSYEAIKVSLLSMSFVYIFDTNKIDISNVHSCTNIISKGSIKASALNMILNSTENPPEKNFHDFSNEERKLHQEKLLEMLSSVGWKYQP